MKQAVLVSAAVLSIAGCSRKPAEAPPSVEANVVYSDNGWSQAERDQYYHLAEGSELMPYALIANLKSTTTGKPFLEGMERFGFLADRVSGQNPRGLPVGVTVSRSRNAGTAGIEIIGFNCAACHVSELTYKGKRLRVDGAPGTVNLQQYQTEFKESLDATLHSPQKLLALVVAMEQQQSAPDTPSAQEAERYAGEPEVQSAGNVAVAPSAVAGPVKSISSAAADAARPTPHGSFRDRLKADITFLKERLAYLKKGQLLTGGTEPGPGRVDAFGAARNLLFPQYAVKMQSPVSYPFIWSVPDNIGRKPEEFGWIHYDGNTNSILERNIGQSLGMGSVFDPVTYQSTLRLANLHQLEILTHKLQPPKWPSEVFGAVDETKAQQGAQIFKEKCESCHQDKLYPQMQIGTDPNRANSFEQPVGATPFPKAVAPILDGLKKRAFADDGVPAAEQAKMDAQPVIWRSTGQYLARPLQGIWATGPYLHNGSVPSLYDMLHPEQRPAKFKTGTREFDPLKVGYQSDDAASGLNVWVFDTSLPGNSNIGHSGDAFGTSLPEEQKAALLEYLKKM
jgi:hypothetical protein